MGDQKDKEQRERNREAREQRRKERLGSDKPICGVCGEDDTRCLELHHLAGCKRDGTTVIVCRNCHRKLSDDQRDHPTSGPSDRTKLDAIGHFLLGLSDLLRIVGDRLYEFGLFLIGLAGSEPIGEAS